LAYELAYYWSLGGTTQALLTPEISDAFPSRAYFQFFLMHGGVLAAVVALTTGLGMRPRPRSVRRTWLITAALALVVGVADWFLDANYMYLRGPPIRPSLYDWLGPWPLSLLTAAATAWVVMEICYLPFGGLRRRPIVGARWTKR